ncbi:hypothetical protein HDU93_000403 [Gonapodya sp. JEL0774]|nr:hypothetical protein HDU93_000403 [Gonapodya sp. JEL0774]
MPQNQVIFEAPSVAIGQILQVMSMGLYNPAGTLVGAVYERFTVQDLCAVLDKVKNSSTPNSLFYILGPDARVIAMSNLGTWDQQQTALTKLVDPVTQNYVLKTIWEFPKSNYTLFNISADAIYSYAGKNLSSPFADSAFYVDDYLFQVTSFTFIGFKYIIVSGAPAADYLGDTIALASNLSATGRTAQIIMIVSACVVAVVMGLISITITTLYVDRPLAAILVAMEKAVKFDFSSIRDGSMKRASAIKEINSTQSSFLSMLQVFADALKHWEGHCPNRTLYALMGMSKPKRRTIRSHCSLALSSSTPDDTNTTDLETILAHVSSSSDFSRDADGKDPQDEMNQPQDEDFAQLLELEYGITAPGRGSGSGTAGQPREEFTALEGEIDLEERLALEINSASENAVDQDSEDGLDDIPPCQCQEGDEGPLEGDDTDASQARLIDFNTPFDDTVAAPLTPMSSKSDIEFETVEPPSAPEWLLSDRELIRHLQMEYGAYVPEEGTQGENGGGEDFQSPSEDGLEELVSTGRTGNEENLNTWTDFSRESGHRRLRSRI